MNDFFGQFLHSSKTLAAQHGLLWDVSYDAEGHVDREHRWNLTKLVGMMPPPTLWMSHVGYDANGLKVINSSRERLGAPYIAQSPMDQHWRDLYLAVILNQLLVRKNKPSNALVSVARWVRLLASVAEGTIPWKVTAEQVREAYNAALQLGGSGKAASNFAMMVRSVIDDGHLFDTPALARFCEPFLDQRAQEAHAVVLGERKRVNSTHQLRTQLAERKSAHKLPEQRAFWELVRIIFTEEPRTFTDVIRFAIMKIGILTGMRVGELVTLPCDWCRWREYVDADGASAGSKGGISRSLMIRHFAEKQAADEAAGGLMLYESVQHVPAVFETMVLEALDSVATLTHPLRARLRLQTSTGRLFPEYSNDALVTAAEMYTRATGNAKFSDVDIPAEMLKEYRKSYDCRVLGRVRDHQSSSGGLLTPVIKYWSNLRRAVPKRDATGKQVFGGLNWAEAYIRVGDVERYFRTQAPTKIPEFKPVSLAGGAVVHSYDLLFLIPIRNLVEGRNNGLLDVDRYFAADRISTSDIQMALTANRSESIFRRYGETEEDRSLELDPHDLRHLQNTELFRLAVSDTIITKRFNRRSVAQSHVYNHRSLAEDLARIDVPASAEALLSPNAAETYRLIQAGKAGGPLIEEFRRIQAAHGDEVAFEYLNVEADGLHVTPFGFCVNSFAVDPCPKHLECFNGCRHLARTAIEEEQENLYRLRTRMSAVIAKLEEQPEKQRSIGWKNQIVHARQSLANIVIALNTKPDNRPFPAGPDLSDPIATADATVLGSLPRRMGPHEQ